MAMTPGERLRVRFLFSALGAIPVFLVGWFGWLQVVQGGELQRGERPPLRLTSAAAEGQQQRVHHLPGPRGTIVDRHGATLAVDCEAFEVRAEVRPPKAARGDAGSLRAYLGGLAERLGAALAHDAGLADRGVAREEYREKLAERLLRAFGLEVLPGRGELADAVPRSAEILVHAGVDVMSVVQALQQLDDDMSSLHLHLLHRHLRAYPAREVTYGLVGHREDLPVHDAETGRLLGYQSYGPVGLEALAALEPGAPGRRDYLVDARSRPFFAGAGRGPAPPTRVVTTLDLELQKVATRELEQQALAAGGEGGTLPQWGALLLVEVETGDLLAAGSWHRDARHRRGAAFAPYQLVYEPGSIVKPLVCAFALQFGGLDWNEPIDCRSTGADHHRVVEAANGRLVRDDHACPALPPHGVLVQSSNIGAVIIGSRLSRDDWARYLGAFGFGRVDPTGRQPPQACSLGLPLPGERVGLPAARGWLPGVTAAAFKKWSGSSYSIGYELQVNALQMARAYLTLLSGRQRELRLLREVEVDGVTYEVPAAGGGPPLFDAAVVEAVRAAMADVVSDQDGATGRFLVREFRQQRQLELHGLLAGKTGTAASHTTIKGRGTVEVRNASFVGFLPAAAPRYLAVCVLQKDDSARFYGGSYAAPPVARLLLEAMHLEERRQLRRGPQVSASPGASGRSSTAPERSQAGR